MFSCLTHIREPYPTATMTHNSTNNVRGDNNQIWSTLSTSTVAFFQLHLLLLLLFGSVLINHTAQSFTVGAGGCDGEGPAVGSIHLIEPITGDLSEGNFEITIGDSKTLDPEGTNINIDETHTLTLKKNDDGVFRGVLFRLEIPIDTVSGVLTAQDPSNFQDAGYVCDTQTGNVVGITHTNSFDKTEASVTLNVDGVVDDIILDVTVVVQNQGISEFYYEQYILNANDIDPNAQQEPTSNPTPIPTTEPTPNPTAKTTSTPTTKQSPAPSPSPIAETSRPTVQPTPSPTARPTSTLTTKPSPGPLPSPSPIPETPSPTTRPTTTKPSPGSSPFPISVTPSPTTRPTSIPTTKPSPGPSPFPIAVTPSPTATPTSIPTTKPSPGPSPIPIAETSEPTGSPTSRPAVLDPTEGPTLGPVTISFRKAGGDASSVQLGEPSFFNDGEPLSPGRYRIQYVDGCMKYHNVSHGWTVNGAWPNFLAWWLVSSGRPNRSALGDVKLPGTAGFTTSDGALGGAFSTFDECVTANQAVDPIVVDLTEDIVVGVWLLDSRYDDNVEGVDGRNPMWNMTLV